jgi:hypothetical protein
MRDQKGKRGERDNNSSEGEKRGGKARQILRRAGE